MKKHLRAHWEKKYRGRYAKWAHAALALDVALMFVVGALAVAAIFLRAVLPAFPLPETVTLAARQHYAVTSGRPVTVEFRYANESAAPIAGAEARLALPPGFAFVASSPDASMDGGEARFAFGTVAPGAEADFSATGIAFGDVGEEITLEIEFFYWKAGAAQRSRISGHTVLRVTGSVADVAVQVPEPLVPGRVADVAVTYAVDGDVDGPLRLVVEPPGDFVTVLATPAAARSAFTWEIDAAADARSGTVSLRGFLPLRLAALARPATFTARIEALRGGAWRTLRSVRTSPAQEESGFEISGGIQDFAGALRPGEPFTVVVAYENRGEKTLRALCIRIVADGNYLDDGERPAREAAIAALSPGERGELRETFVLARELDAATVGDSAPTVVVAADATFFLDGDAARPLVADIPPLHAPVATTLAVRGVARYRLADEQVGAGVVPPSAGETTSYRVFLSAESGAGAAEGVVVTARLPDNVMWTGSSSVTRGEAVDYLPSTRTLRWRVGGMTRFTRDGAATASVELAITPRPEQSGDFAELLNELAIEGEDAATDAKIRAVVGAVLTEHAVR